MTIPRLRIRRYPSGRGERSGNVALGLTYNRYYRGRLGRTTFHFLIWNIYFEVKE